MHSGAVGHVITICSQVFPSTISCCCQVAEGSSNPFKKKHLESGCALKGCGDQRASMLMFIHLVCVNVGR